MCQPIFRCVNILGDSFEAIDDTRNSLSFIEFFLFCKVKTYHYVCYTIYNTNITHITIDMETIERKQTAFRLRKDLLEKIKKDAAKENRSVNNYVETLLLDAVYREPNEDTLEAIKEAMSGKSAGTLDLSDFDSFMKSVNEIE